jgi:catechol 2,3-dioxygenase-like lactoylglutathione lyase family enzyme
MFPAINVLDLKATEGFYSDILGMKPTLRIGDEGSEHQEVTLNFSGEIGAPETSLVLNYLASRTEPYLNDALSRIAFRVPDVDAMVERVRAAGHTILSEPRMIEVNGTGIKLAFVQDPNGTRVELIQPMGPIQASKDGP